VPTRRKLSVWEEGKRVSGKKELENFEIRKAKFETNLNDKRKKFETL